MSSLRKLFIDSRFRFSGTSSNFTIELPEAQEMPENYSMWISSITFPHSWTTVNSTNEFLYFLERDGVNVLAYRVQVPNANYSTTSFATQLETNLNAAGVGAYIVTATEERLSISGSLEFKIPTQRELANPVWKEQNWSSTTVPPSYSISDVRSLNTLLNETLSSTFGTTHLTPIIDLSSTHNLYLHSNLTNWASTLDPSGRKSVVSKIPISVQYGYTVVHEGNGSGPQEGIDISNLRFKNASFSLRNIYGHEMDLRGGHLSLTACFGPSAH